MSRELLTRAVEQARHRDPLVRAMTLVGASRAMTALDEAEARRLYADGVADAEQLRESDHRRTVILLHVVRIGLTVDPVAAADLFRRQPGDHPNAYTTGTMVVQALARVGEGERAVALLEDPMCETGGAGGVVAVVNDHGLKLRAMFAAWERWRAERSGARRFGRMARDDFFRLVCFHWRVLGEQAADRWLGEILQIIETEPDEPLHAGFDRGVVLHASRDLHLFHVLNMLRALRSEQEVDAILARHPAVAAAAVTFPLGLESVVSQPAAPPPATRAAADTQGFCFVGGGDSRDMDVIPTLMAARRGERSAVDTLFASAHRAFREDTDLVNGNLAPLPFWPSCVAYKRALYWAGRIIGGDAERLIDDMPEPDIALLSSVECAAGTLGLEESPGLTMTRRPRRL